MTSRFGTQRSWWMGASIFLLTCGSYLNSLDNSFHYDDSHSIVENHHIRSLANIPVFFTDPRSFSREPAMAMYRPVLLATYALNYHLDKYRPRGYHLVSIGLHGCVALLVYLIIQGTTGRPFLGWWGGVFFGLHPVHAQAVNYISSRSEILSALGVLIAFYLMVVKREKSGWALTAYGSALLAKSAALALLPLLLLYEWLRPAQKRSLKAHIPFWILTLAYLGVISLNGFLPRSLAQDVRPFDVQIWTQIKALAYYLKLVVMPVGLSVEHGFNMGESLVDGAVLSGLGLVLSLGYVALRGLRQRAWGSQALGWFLAAMALTFVVPLNVLVSEHRLYLASVGCLLGVLGSMRGQRPVARLMPLAWGLVLVLGMLTWQRNQIWQDELSLWQDAARKAPDMFRVQSNLGLAHYEAGELQPALAAFERSLELNPHYSKIWSNLGLVHEDLGQFARAKEMYKQALNLRGDLAGTFNNLGRLSSKRGRALEAEASLKQALEIDSTYAPAHVNLGLVYQQSGRWAEAAEEYEEALELDPEYAEGYNNLGLVYADLGRVEEAIQALQQAIRLQPGYSEAQINVDLLQLQQQGIPPLEAYQRLLQVYPESPELWRALGDLQARNGAWEEAVKTYLEVLERGAVVPGTHRALASAYRSLGRLADAITAYEKALEEKPEDPALCNNLASAYAAAGRVEEAILTCRRVLEFDPDNVRASGNLRRLLQALERQD